MNNCDTGRRIPVVVWTYVRAGCDVTHTAVTD